MYRFNYFFFVLYKKYSNEFLFLNTMKTVSSIINNPWLFNNKHMSRNVFKKKILLYFDFLRKFVFY